jgi:hypothetical protein
MRKTITTGNEYSSRYFRQEKLDTFWNLIEDKYDEDWRVESNGDVTLEVDDAMLERILSDNSAIAWYDFGSFRGGQREDGTRFYLARPEYLKGTYIIKGIYAPDLSYVRGDYQKREYFFVQEGF